MQLTEKDYDKYRKFILGICASCFRRYKTRKFEVDDLESEAWIAFSRAKETFDATKGIPFKGYAGSIIKNALILYINVNIFEFKANYENIRKNDYEFNKLKATKFFPIVHNAKENGVGVNEEIIPNNYNDCPLQNAEMAEITAILKTHVNNLPVKQKIAIIKRFKDELTYEEIGKIIGVTKQQVLNLLQNAIKNLKEKLHGIND